MLEKNIIRVAIADDHVLLREGIAATLEVYDHLELVGQASNGVEAVTLCHQTQPDVALIDLRMPEMDGIAVIQEIKATIPRTQIIVFTSIYEETDIQAALEAGAISYLLKHITPDELVSAIEQADQGRTTLSAQVKQSLIEMMQRPQPMTHDLTPREKEVMQLLIQGYTNESMADHLHITTSTVKKHVRNICDKLNASNRTESVAIALREGFADSGLAYS